MLDTVLGLPVHPLIVHATVVLVPLTALLVIAAAVSGRARSWLGPVPAVAAVLCCGLVPLTTSSGEALEHRLPDNPLIEHHQELADTLIWLVLPLAVVAVAAWFVRRRGVGGRTLLAAVSVLAVLLAVGTLVDVTLIGHSGAKASWSGVGRQSAGG